MPVLGGPAAVSAGQAMLLAGGNASVVDRLAPMIGSLSGHVRRYDTSQLALTAKLTTNLMLLSGVVAFAESFAVGRSGGLGEDQLRDLLGLPVAAVVQDQYRAAATGHANADIAAVSDLYRRAPITVGDTTGQ
jgi:3-hydroxyisobutyrate dehydrogenase